MRRFPSQPYPAFAICRYPGFCWQVQSALGNYRSNFLEDWRNSWCGAKEPTRFDATKNQSDVHGHRGRHAAHLGARPHRDIWSAPAPRTPARLRRTPYAFSTLKLVLKCGCSWFSNASRHNENSAFARRLYADSLT
eukprot:5404845-Pleurochrysis_carterae.AAC.5